MKPHHQRRLWPPVNRPVHTVESKGTSERVPFRLIQTPCCMTLLCWVNPRLPSYCPECGKSIYPAVKSCVLTHDENATLRVSRFYVTTPRKQA